MQPPPAKQADYRAMVCVFLAVINGVFLLGDRHSFRLSFPVYLLVLLNIVAFAIIVMLESEQTWTLLLGGSLCLAVLGVLVFPLPVHFGRISIGRRFHNDEVAFGLMLGIWAMYPFCHLFKVGWVLIVLAAFFIVLVSAVLMIRFFVLL